MAELNRFMKKEPQQKQQPQNICLVMDSSSVFLARGELQSPPDAPNIHIKIIEGSTNDVVDADVIQAVPVDQSMPAWLGRVIFRRGNVIVLDPFRKLGTEVRQNLRMPVAFDSFVYPEGDGKQVPIRSVNLSCGGVAFTCPTREFQNGDRMEVVIPLSRGEPLVLWCEILRTDVQEDQTKVYAVKFLHLLHDEEALLRETVFNVQIETNRAKKNQARRR